jgi:hypothetical protein
VARWWDAIDGGDRWRFRGSPCRSVVGVHGEGAGTREIAAAATTAEEEAKRMAGNSPSLERRGPFAARAGTLSSGGERGR